MNIYIYALIFLLICICLFFHVVVTSDLRFEGKSTDIVGGWPFVSL